MLSAYKILTVLLYRQKIKSRLMYSGHFANLVGYLNKNISYIKLDP